MAQNEANEAGAIDESLAKLEAQQRKLKNKIAHRKGIIQRRTRKEENQRLIIIGRLIEKFLPENDKLKTWFDDKIDGYLTENRLRKLFDLPLLAEPENDLNKGDNNDA